MENEKLSIEIGVKEFKMAVALAGNAVPGNPVIPLYTYLLVRILDSEKKIELTATDGNITIITKCDFIAIDVSDFEETEFLLPYKLLHELLVTLPDTPIMLKSFHDPGEKEDIYGISINYESNDYELPSESPREFPKAKKQVGESFDIASNVLKEGLAYVKDCVYTIDTHSYPALSGVLFDFSNPFLRFVGCNRFLMSIYESKIITSGQTTFSLPLKCAQLVHNNVVDDDREATITIFDSRCMFEMEHLTIISTLIDEQYPDYKMSIGVEFSHETHINVDNWKAVLKRALIFANPMTMSAKLTFKGDKMFLSTETSSTNSKSVQHVEIQEEIEDFEIFVNGKNLKTLLNVFSGVARVGMIEPRKPMYIMPVSDKANQIITLAFPQMIGPL